MKILRKYIYLSLLLLISFSQELWAQRGEQSLLPLTIRGKTIRVEVVRTEKEKERGLMFRERLEKMKVCSSSMPGKKCSPSG